ncbi:MAG: BMP family ABC transporter substrate-binding protein [Ureaplasma sp.]|nr:BMP family ABC transporter substrate-binding protein [Ureaplasma sp.]MDE7221688.1 BMP family ABC transporter substrate-binding protein [Ureaplasma sp.]
MLKKKYIITMITAPIVVALATGIGVSYYYSSQKQVYNYYYTAPSSSSNSDIIQSYFASVVNGAKFLYLPSYIHGVPLTDALNITEQQNKILYSYFNKTGFLLLDSNYGFPVFNEKTDSNGKVIQVDGFSGSQSIWTTNVAAVLFRADLGSFITGIAAAQLLNENQDYFGEELTWCTYGGLPFSTVTCFMGGFERGIEFFNQNIVPLKQGYKEVKKILLSENQTGNFANGFDPNQGDDLINNFLNKKPSLILPVAGPQIGSAARLIRQRNLRTIVIGVDSAVEEDDTINLPLVDLPSNKTIGNNKIVQFSSVKNLGDMLNLITQNINSGKNLPNSNAALEVSNIGGIGYSSLGTLFNGGVGVSKAGEQFFISAMEILDGVQYDSYMSALKSTNPIFVQKLQELDKPENKTYSLGSGETFSYADITNNGAQMLPISGSDVEIKQWLKDYYNDNDDIIEQRFSIIKNWIASNQQTLNIRKELNLTNQFNKQDYLNNKNISRIIFQSPTSILFDNSFYQSCYSGLIDYWKKQGVELPPIPKK